MSKDIIQKIQKLFILGLTFYFLLISTISYALVFNIDPKAGTSLPTTVNVNSTVTAYYTVLNHTTSQRNNNYVKYLPPNVSQVTSGGTYSDTCSSSFNLAPYGQSGSSCTLQLTVSGAVNGNDSNPHNHLFVCWPGGITCGGTNEPLNVTQTSEKTLSSIALTPSSASIFTGNTEQYTATGTYSDGSTANLNTSVTWHSSNTSVATISSTGLATGVAKGITNITASLDSITSPLVALSVTNAHLYVTNFNNSTVSICQIMNDGSLNTCTTSNGNGTFSSPASLTINSAGTFAYIPNLGNNTVSICPINSDFSLGTCVTTTASATLSGPTGISLNPANSIAYIANLFSGQVSICPITGGGASFGACTTFSSASFNQPQGITINSADTYAYVSNANDTVSICPVNGASLDTCTVSTGTGTFAFPQGVSFNSSGAFAYVGNYTNNTVSICTVSGNALNTCQTTTGNSTFDFSANTTVGLYMPSTSTYGYIPNSGNNTVSICKINESTGGFTGTCSTSIGPDSHGTSTFNQPSGISMAV